MTDNASVWMVSVGLTFTIDSVDEFKTFLLDAYDELRRLEGSPEMSGILADGKIQFVMVVRTGDREDASKHADTAVRAALHCAGTNNPGWEEKLQELHLVTTPCSDYYVHCDQRRTDAPQSPQRSLEREPRKAQPSQKPGTFLPT